MRQVCWAPRTCPQPEDIKLSPDRFKGLVQRTSLYMLAFERMHHKSKSTAAKLPMVTRLSVSWAFTTWNPPAHTPFFAHGWKTKGKTIPDTQKKIVRLLLRCVKCYVKDRVDISSCTWLTWRLLGVEHLERRRSWVNMSPCMLITSCCTGLNN